MSIYQEKLEFDEGIPYLKSTLDLPSVLCPGCHHPVTFLNERAYCDTCQKRVVFKKDPESQRNLGFLWLKEAMERKGTPQFLISLFKKAKSAFQKSLKEEENVDAFQALSLTLTKIGNLYIDLHEYTKALSSFKAAAKWMDTLILYQRDASSMYDFGQFNYSLYRFTVKTMMPGVRKYLAAAIEWVDKACTVEKNRDIEWAMHNTLELYALAQAQHYQSLHLRKEITTSTAYLAKVLEQNNKSKTRRFPVDPGLLPALPEVLGNFYFERYPEKGERLMIFLAEQAFNYFISQKSGRSLSILEDTLTSIIDICMDKHKITLGQKFVQGLLRLPENSQVLELKEKDFELFEEAELQSNWSAFHFYRKYYGLGDMKACFDRMLTILEQIYHKDPSLTNYERLIRANYQLAIAYQDQKKPDLMMNQIYHVLNLIRQMPEVHSECEELKNIQNMLWSLNEAVFNTFKRKHNTTEGITYMKRVLQDFARSSQRKYGALTRKDEREVYLHLARFYRQMKEEKQEATCLEKAQEIEEALHGPFYRYEDSSD